MNLKFLLASLKHIRTFVPAFLLSPWLIFSSLHAIAGTSIRITGGFRTIFRVTGDYLEAGTSFLKMVTGRIFIISK
jgi:hypothetical protein